MSYHERHTQRTDASAGSFSEAYRAALEWGPQCVDEVAETLEAAPVSERMLQVIWYEQSITSSTLRTMDGHTVEVVSPGWWNQQAGPDFRGAQLVFNGTLFSGDVEIHLGVEGWQAHGHHLDARYEAVILHVVLDAPAAPRAVETVSGRRVPLLVLRPYLQADWAENSAEEDEVEPGLQAGACSALLPRQGAGPLLKALELAAEWRMLHKARMLGERMARVGGNQAVYEALMYAAGYSTFKHHFQEVARQLPYERAVQLAHHDPLLLEAALLQIAGLLPEQLGGDAGLVPHHARLCTLRREHLGGLRQLPLVWKRNGLRPANYPERRLAGMARVMARTARDGLMESIMALWRGGDAPRQLHAGFEKLFPAAMGFWATHYTWTGKHLEQAAAPLGGMRVRSIIGNVFLPLGLAVARSGHDRALEERVLAFFQWLPKEADNHVLERMTAKLTGESGLKIRPKFQVQQGMLQFYQDWCGPNPSCRNCSMRRYLDVEQKTG